MSLPSATKRGRRKTKDEDNDDEEYRRKRDKNNLAVKKSRVKSRQKTQETLMRVQQLKSENDQLEEKIKLLSKELCFLKDLFMAHAGNTTKGSAHGINLKDVDLQKLLNDPDDSQPPTNYL